MRAVLRSPSTPLYGILKPQIVVVPAGPGTISASLSNWEQSSGPNKNSVSCTLSLEYLLYPIMTQPSQEGRRFSEQMFERLLAQTDAVWRYLILINSGGAVSTLGAIGALAESGRPFWYAIVPLATFVLGVIAAGVTLVSDREATKDVWVSAFSGDIETRNGLLVGSGDPSYEPSLSADKWATRARRAAWISFVLFSLGAILGVIGLAVLSGESPSLGNS